jgi:hypothetical protein
VKEGGKEGGVQQVFKIGRCHAWGSEGEREGRRKEG